MLIVIALVLLVVLAGLAIGRAVIKSHYYIDEYNGKVTILRGIQGSLLGISLYQPYLVACVKGSNEVALISYGQSGPLDCHLLTLHDLRPPGQAQVQSRQLPGGTLDQAESQLRKLLADSLLPPCPPPARATSPPNPTTGGTPEQSPTTSPTSTTPTTTATPGASTTPTTSTSPASPTSSAATSSPTAPATTSPPANPQPVTPSPSTPPRPGIECRAAA
jgi:PPM family protein phosphatase